MYTVLGTSFQLPGIKGRKAKNLLNDIYITRTEAYFMFPTFGEKTLDISQFSPTGRKRQISFLAL